MSLFFNWESPHTSCRENAYFYLGNIGEENLVLVKIFRKRKCSAGHGLTSELISNNISKFSNHAFGNVSLDDVHSRDGYLSTHYRMGDVSSPKSPRDPT